jgi:hypothetical protein
VVVGDQHRDRLRHRNLAQTVWRGTGGDTGSPSGRRPDLDGAAQLGGAFAHGVVPDPGQVARGQAVAAIVGSNSSGSCR